VAGGGPPPIRPPNKRHYIARVGQRTTAKTLNSVVESRVDVDADIAAINRGEATRQGDRYAINGRTYGVEPSGVAYPISGPGVHLLDRGAFKALGVYNTFGRTQRAEMILDAMGVGPGPRAEALRCWFAERSS
jgi:hypothetical protein